MMPFTRKVIHISSVDSTRTNCGQNAAPNSHTKLSNKIPTCLWMKKTPEILTKSELSTDSPLLLLLLKT